VKKRTMAILAGSLCAVLGSRAWSQDNLERFQRELDQLQRETRTQADFSVPADQRAVIDYGAYLNALFVGFPKFDEDHTLQQYEAVAFGRVNLDGAQEFFIRGRYDNRIFSDNSRLDGEPDEENQIDRLYYRFDLAKYLAANKGQLIGGDVNVTAGRQLVNWGNGLVLSQAIDGGVIDASIGNATAEFLGGRTYYNQTDIDPNRPNFIDNEDRTLWGTMVSYQFPKNKPFIYFLHQQDENGSPVLTSTTSSGGVSTTTSTAFHYDSYYIGGGSSGEITDHLLYSVELTYEGGNTLSRSTGSTGTQTNDEIQAFAADARLDYLFADQRKTRWTEEFIAATGDSDRGISNSTFNGNQPNTRDNGFNAFGLLNTGLAFAPAVSNVMILRSGITTYPWADSQAFSRLQLGADLLLYSKFESGAPIDEPSNANWWLGTELDFSATWQITSDVSLLVRYGLFFPGSALDSGSDPRNFVAVGVTYAF
jgi:Alginate export